MKKFLTILILLALILSCSGCGAKDSASSWQEQYDLGVRYLSEGNYEEAIIAFEAAIEIDPRQPEAYISLADAYMSIGEYEHAYDAIQRGREVCGDLDGFSRVLDNITFLQSGNIGIQITDLYFDKAAYLSGKETTFLVSVAYRCPENQECILMIGANTEEPDGFTMMDQDYAVEGSGGYQFKVSIAPVTWDNRYFGIYVNLSEAEHAETWTPFASDILYIDLDGNVVDFSLQDEQYFENYKSNLIESGFTDNMLRFDEIHFLGHSIKNLNIQTMKSIMTENGFYLNEQNDGDTWWVRTSKARLSSGPSITAMQYKDEDYVCLWSYDTAEYYADKEQLAIGVRNIKTYDSLDTVLSELGFSNGAEISVWIQEIALKEFDTFDDLCEIIGDQLNGANGSLMVNCGGTGAFQTDNGKYRLHELTLNISFTDANAYGFSFRFGGTASPEYNNRLIEYTVHYFPD